MPIDAGRLDRKIGIYAPTTTIGSAGGVAVTYAIEQTISAQKIEVRGTESRSAGALRAETSLILRIRYRPTLNEKYRILYDARNYDVISIVEEGRRETQVVQCKFTEGAA